MRAMRIKTLAVAAIGTLALGFMCGCQGERAQADDTAHAGDQACDHDHDHGSHAPADGHAGAHGHEMEDSGAAHEGHAHEEEGGVIRMSERELQECGVTLAYAGPGRLTREIVIPGEVRINGDRLVHMVPRVPGIVTEVRKTLGDEVKVGEVLAVVESNELADARVDYLAARERLSLAESNFKREKNLWEKEITSEQEYLDAKSKLTEAGIQYRSSEQKLFALGLTEAQVAGLNGHDEEVFTRYEVRSPIDATVVEKHITLGEKVGDDSDMFLLADLSTVWIDLSITQKDFPFVREGMEAVVSAGYGVPDAKGSIDYVSPVVGEATRTAIARMVLPNPDGHWRPGLFVSAEVTVDQAEVPVMIPRAAAQQMDDHWVVFVDAGDGFEAVDVRLGRGDREQVEVLAGLRPGQRYVAEGAFECKAKIVTSDIDPHAGHGH